TVLAREQATDDGLYQLRQRIAAAVIARLRPDIPGISSHFWRALRRHRRTGSVGVSPHRRSVPCPCVRVRAVAPVRRAGRHRPAGGRAPGRWVPPRRTWSADFNAGIAGRGVNDRRHRPAAVEYQANLPVLAIDEVPVEDTVYKTSDLCRQVARVGA